MQCLEEMMSWVKYDKGDEDIEKELCYYIVDVVRIKHAANGLWRRK